MERLFEHEHEKLYLFIAFNIPVTVVIYMMLCDDSLGCVKAQLNYPVLTVVKHLINWLFKGFAQVKRIL